MKKIIQLSVFILCITTFTLAQGVPDAESIKTGTSQNPYVTKVFTDDSGKEIEAIIVPGRPPENYRAPVAKLPDPNNENANVLTNVPAFSWSFGCSATSAAMIAGYYDRTGYENMYSGPTNGGIMPLNNSSWPDVVINGETRSQCPLSATRMGVDGRAEKGHVDDYWYMYGSEQDPYYGNWTQHDYGECTADYMGTNQFYNFGTTDGATRFYSYTDGSPLYDYTGCEPGERDGCHGFKLFMESRGYNVQPNGNYSQRIYGYEGNTLGFTWNDFKAEIDAGRPVLIQIIGHTMVGFGYDESGGSQLVYIHDTWDYNDHTMEWGGTYSDMQHYGVVVMMPEPQVTVLNPPRNLSVDGQGYATWDAPQSGTENIISHHNGYANNGIGTNSTASWVSAARFDTDDLASYYGSDLTSVNLHIRLDLFTYVELRIYKGGSFGNPGSMIYAEDITNDILIDDWTTINLSAPVMLEAGNEYWIGYYIDATGGQPASNDFGPAVADKGDWMNFGGSWVEISTEYGLNVNWCIEGVVTDNKNTGQPKTLSHQSRATGDLLYYNIYLDGSFVGNTTDIFWQYNGLNAGTAYTAGVSAVYSDGESNMIEYDFTLPLLAPPENFEVTDQGYATWDSPVEPIFEDDFESYTAGQFLTVQSPEWDTWSFSPGSTEDAYVTTDQALSGNNSVKIDGTSDVMHRFGDLTSGHYLLSANIYVRSGYGGYFNVMHHFGSPHVWACEAYFSSDGTGFMTAGGVNDIPFTYSTNSWTNVVLDIDLDGDWAIATINGTQVYAWQWSLDAFTGDQGISQLDAIDFYSQAPYGQNPLYYFDDVMLLSAGSSDALTSYNLYLNGTPVGNTTNTYYQLTGLNPGQTYTAGVTAVYDEGESGMVTNQFTVPGTAESYAPAFDGDDDFINCGHDASLNITEALTVEAWINPSGWGEETDLGYGRIIDKNRIKLFLVNDGGSYYNNQSLVFIMHSGGSSYMVYTPENAITLNEWQHVAATYNGNGIANLYINGVQQVVSGTPPTGSLMDHSGDDLYIGESVTETRAFEGLIDEVRMWNVVRSESEIQDQMFSYLTGTETGLAGYWPMNEGLGSFVYDFSENNNTGQLGSTTGNDADDPEWTPTDWPYMLLEADFSATPLFGNSPLTVQFTDESTGNPTSWEWDFDNDGTIDSYEQNPEYTFINIGDFSVSLSVDGAAGSASETKNDYINVSPANIYNIQHTSVPGPDNTWPSTYDGQTLTTSGIVTAVGYNGQPNNFFVSEPDAGPWKGIYIYNAGDTPAVGDEVVLTGTITEYFGMTEINAPAVSIISSGNPVPVPMTISSGILSSANEGEPYEGCLVNVEDVLLMQLPNANNEWYVSDGSGECQIDDRMFNYVPVTGETFSYIAGAVDYSFDEYGINPRNNEDIESSLLTIYDIQYTDEPGPENTYPSPYIGQEVTISGVVTGKGYDGVDGTFFISEPNGNAWSGILVFQAGLTPQPGDEVLVQGEIVEYFGMTEIHPSEISLISTGNPVPPPIIIPTGNLTSSADAEAYEGCLVKVENVIVTVLPNDINEWYVNDGSGECQIDDHIFEYNPVLMGQEFNYIMGAVNYNYDEYAINPRFANDLESTSLIAEFSASPLTGDVPLTVQFTDESVVDPTTWEWDFDNDGTIDSYEQNPEFIYTESGVYTVTLTVYDSKGSDTETKTDYITVNSNLNADFTWDVSMGPAPLTVQFTDLSSGNPISWEWDFENDGIVDSYVQHPEFTYETPGTYSIKLTVSDGYTTDSQLIGYIDVLVPLEAAFVADVSSGAVPLTVQFTDLSTGDPSSWEWDFENDGIIDSYVQHPEFTYMEAGIYSVSLTAINDFGEDTKTRFDYIIITEPFVCLPPTDLTATGITSHSASLSWNPGGVETQWEVIWGDAGFDPTTNGNLMDELTETTAALSDLNPQSDYDFYVRAVCGTEANSEWAGPETFMTEAGSPPDWEPVPYLQYNMQVIGQLQYLDGTPSLNENDMVAAFANDECRGVISPNPGINGLLFLTVGSNQQAGETITFKAYIANSDEVVDLNQTMAFENQKQTGTIADPFIFNWSDPISHTVQIPQGWSGISSYVIPEDASVANIFAPVQNELVILQNFDGMYWPTAGVNTLGNWDDHAGYQVKLETAQQVTFSGSMQGDLTANLTEGWNYLPVLNACDNDADELFGQIIGNLQIVKEVAGYGVYWPQFGINTLGTVVPGRAYFVKVNADVSLDFPECTPILAFPLKGEGDGRHTAISHGELHRASQSDGTPLSLRRGAGGEVVQGWGEVTKTPLTHTIAFPLESCQGLAEGSIISIYNQQGICCGAAVFQNHNLVITAFGDDPTTPQVDGLVQGEPLRFRIIDPETGNSSPMKVDFDYNLPNGENFAAHGLSAIKTLQVTELEDLTGSGTDISIYPNPSNGVFNIHGDLTGFSNLSGLASWEITDIHGSVIATGRNHFDDFTIDISNHPKGIYYIKITQGGLQVVRKLVLQ